MAKTTPKYPTFAFRVRDEAKAEIMKLVEKAQERRNSKLGVTESPKTKSEIIVEALIDGLKRMSKP